MKNEVGIDSLLKSLNQLSVLSFAAQEAIGACFIPYYYKKREIISEPGTISNKILFITKGAVREFFFQDNNEKVTSWFGFEGDLAVSIASFLNQENSHSGFEALEDVACYGILRNDLYRLYDEYHEIERLGRILAEKYLIKIESFHNESKYNSAIERYEILISERPEIVQRVSSKHIATFLGVSTETLSRIRGKKL